MLLKRVFDAHADSAVLPDLNGEDNQLKLSDIYDYDRYTQVFAVCMEVENPKKYAREKVDNFLGMIKNEKLTLVRGAEDLDAKYAAVLALEGADAIDTLSALDFFYKKGVRLMTLTWNRENDIVSNCFSEKDEGLKPFGRRLILEMERRGMVIDLAHSSDRGFFDVCEIVKKPCVVSHANSRKVFFCERNITDEMYMRIARLHGCVGVTFEPLFGAGSLEDIVRHIEHFCALDSKCVGIGSDFDGISRLPEEVRGAGSIYDIANRLLRLNYSEKTVLGVMCENFMRVFKEILQKGIA